MTSPAMPMTTPLMTVRYFFIGSIVAMGGLRKAQRVADPFRPPTRSGCDYVSG